MFVLQAEFRGTKNWTCCFYVVGKVYLFSGSAVDTAQCVDTRTTGTHGRVVAVPLMRSSEKLSL